VGRRGARAAQQGVRRRRRDTSGYGAIFAEHVTKANRRLRFSQILARSERLREPDITSALNRRMKIRAVGMAQ